MSGCRAGVEGSALAAVILAVELEVALRLVTLFRGVRVVGVAGWMDGVGWAKNF